MRQGFVVILFLFAVIRPVWADDSVGFLTQSGIEFTKTDAIRMKDEYLSITPQKIHIKFIFQNDSDLDITTEVGFPMPPSQASTGPDGGRYLNRGNIIPDFSIFAAGTKIESQVRYRASMGDKDITAELQKLSIPVDKFPLAKDISKNILRQLIQKGYYSDGNPDEEFEPTYAIQATYFWQQTFPAHHPIVISHEYQPTLGGNSIGALNNDWKGIVRSDLPNGCYSRPELIDDNPLPGNFKEFSLEQQQSFIHANTQEKDCVKQLKAEGIAPGKFSSEYLHYVLATGSNWKNGLENFRLHIEGAAVIFVSLEGAESANLGSIDILKKNFYPTQDLIVEFMGQKISPVAPPFLDIARKIDGPANCRKRINGQIVSLIPDQEIAYLRKRQNDWYQVQYGNETCWTHSQNLPYLWASSKSEIKN